MGHFLNWDTELNCCMLLYRNLILKGFVLLNFPRCRVLWPSLLPIRCFLRKGSGLHGAQRCHFIPKHWKTMTFPLSNIFVILWRSLIFNWKIGAKFQFSKFLQIIKFWYFLSTLEFAGTRWKYSVCVSFSETWRCTRKIWEKPSPSSQRLR